MFQYPVTLKREKTGGYLVTFADIPEAITQAETILRSFQPTCLVNDVFDRYLGKTIPGPDEA
jgi:hypothetical protein